MSHPNIPPPTERLMTPAEVAVAFRVHRRTVARWVRAGQLAAIKTPGGQHRYREADVRAILNGGQQ